MNRILLITRPRHDVTTHYLFYWAKELIELAVKKGIQVLDLRKERANKKEFTSMVSKKQPCFIFFNGHGGANCIGGHNDEILVEGGKNERLLKSKIIYALSCGSGKELGPKSIKLGTMSYIGYDDDFLFVFDEDKATKPLEDSTAKLFLYPSNHVVRCLLKGHTAKDSSQRSKEKFMENIQKLLTSKSPFVLIPYLLWDMRHQVCLGQDEAVF